MADLSKELNKHTTIFKNLDSYEDGGDGGDGDSGERNYFRKLCERLYKDNEALLTDVARKVLTLDNSRNIKEANEEAELWESQGSAILNQMDNILETRDDPGTDKFLLISKLLNIREDLQR